MILPQHLAAAVCSGKVGGNTSGNQLTDSAGQSPLFYAVHCGNDKYVRQLIQTPQLIHQADKDGRSVLAIAVGRGELKIVQDLIATGADVCSKDSDGVTPLHLSTKCSAEVMKVVFSKLSAHNVDVADSCGRTALHWAAALAKETVCRALLQAGANPAKLDQNRRTPLHWLSISENVDSAPSVATLFLKTYPDLVRWQDVRGATPFHLAACSGNVDLLATLLEFADRDTINRADNLFRTALHYSCALGHVQVTAKLLECGAKIDTADCEGATPAHLAAYWNHAECLSVLIEKGGPAFVSSLRDSAGLNPLFWAVARRNFEAARCLVSTTTSPPSSLLLVAAANGDDAMVDLLLSNGVRVSEELDSRTSSTALIYAAYHGHVTVMMTLVYRGKANPKQTDIRGRTALHWAAMSGSASACQFLLEVSCPHDAVEYLGCTALHCAAFSSAECVKVLLKVLPVECKDRYGFTPLHWACLGRNAASAKQLLAAGAAVNALGKTRDRQTPLDCALRRNATEAAELLVAAGGMTAHGLTEYSATLIQSMWRGFRVRRTIKVVQRHELRLAKQSQKLRSMGRENAEEAPPVSPFKDDIVDAVYYGMGKRPVAGKEGEASSSDNFYGDNASGLRGKYDKDTSQSADVAPPLVSMRRDIDEKDDDRAVATGRDIHQGVHFDSTPQIVFVETQRDDDSELTASTSQPRQSINDPEGVHRAIEAMLSTGSFSFGPGETPFAMGGLMSVVSMIKKKPRRFSIFGVVSENADDYDEDEDLTEEELRSKYYKLSEDQIILEESAQARKLRVDEMRRVEAVRARFTAATVIQRAWRRYKKKKKNTQTQKLTARQMRLRAGEQAWRRQMAAITLQNAWRKHHRTEVLKTVHKTPDLQQVQSPLSNMMRSTRQAVLVSSIYGACTANHGASTARKPPSRGLDKRPVVARPTVKPLSDTKPRPAAISFNFAHRQYTSPVITASSQNFRSHP